jgi:hypothetical protein
MNNLFGEEFEDKPQENQCAAKKERPNAKKTSTPVKSKLDEELPSRLIQVKMYNDFYMYEAPESVEKPTLDNVRKWMVEQNGFTELMDSARAGLMIVKPEGEGQEPYVYCGVKFEKQG